MCMLIEFMLFWGREFFTRYCKVLFVSFIYSAFPVDLYKEEIKDPSSTRTTTHKAIDPAVRYFVQKFLHFVLQSFNAIVLCL